MAILDFDECKEAGESVKFWDDNCRKPGSPKGKSAPAGCYDDRDQNVCFNKELDVSKWNKGDNSYRAVCKLKN